MIRRLLSKKPARCMLWSMTRTFTDAQTIRTPHPFEQYASMTNLEYLESVADVFKQDKNLVDPSWHHMLGSITSATPDEALVDSFTRPENLEDNVVSEKDRADNMRLAWMVRAYEFHGHHIATLDPLGLGEADLDIHVPNYLEPSRFGFTAADMERVFYVNFGTNFGAMVTHGKTPMKLRDVIQKLKALYCGNIGFDFMYSGYFELRNWFRNEIANAPPFTAEHRKVIFNDVATACGFEAFLQKKWATQKRFGLDGGEALIAAMREIINTGSDLGVNAVVMGMPHRGRLNVLSNVVGKAAKLIFQEFEGKTFKDDILLISGDVKYHKGLRNEIKARNGKTVLIELLANPSHLEIVNPVVVGKTRAKQHYTGDTTFEQCLPIVLHGDAALAGQGTNYEALGLADLENFHVGGTIHIVVNNQVGFTTNPVQSRSTSYCTDLSKICNAPVLHVNGDDVDSVVRCARMAINFRQKFKRDIFIDIVCYRRYGHNETDVPSFTQPLMYQKIEKHPRLVDLYAKKLIDEQVITPEYAKFVRDGISADLHKEFDESKDSEDFKQQSSYNFEVNSTAYANLIELEVLSDTGLSREILTAMGERLFAIPTNFSPHKTVKTTYESRMLMLQKGEVDWGMAEALAWGGLAQEGIHIRLTGQDVERGTFSHRHAVLTDYNSGAKYTPLKHVSRVQASVTIQNSSLSELGVTAFEHGFGLENPKQLVIWEAQYGDFANGAQIVFDQFLSSGEAKWGVQNGLTISLPHGYQGAGPEHSSCRIERFLQMSDDEDQVPVDFRANMARLMTQERIKRHNWQVCYPSTPANLYHMMRRQCHRSFRKPLIYCFSKLRLRAPNLSKLDELTKGSFFQRVIDTNVIPPSVTPRKLVFCSGQIGSIMQGHKATKKADDIAIVFLEQIAPFPWEDVARICEKYFDANSKIEVVWLQEEPKNMGMWPFVRPRLQSLLRHLEKIDFGPTHRVTYIGRPVSASTSEGLKPAHIAAEQHLVNQVFG